MTLYLYGLCRRGEVQAPEDLKGLADQPVRVEPVRTLEAIVTDFAESVLQTNRENLLAHERVLDVVLEFSTPLPFRFGTVVTPDRLLEFVTANEEALNTDLQRVEGHVQMTARLVLKSAAHGQRTPLPPETEQPGTRFLKERQSRRHALSEAAAWLTEAMGPLVQNATTSISGDRPAMATVAHLVARSDVDSYRLRFDEVCGKRLDLSSSRSGPWPPYGFVSTGKEPVQRG